MLEERRIMEIIKRNFLLLLCMHKTNHSPCPLCKNKQASIVYPALNPRANSSYSPADSTREEGAIVKCTRCKVIYKYPFPKSLVLQQGYEESIDEQYLAFLPERRATFRQVISSIERHIGKRQKVKNINQRILDIGCAEGTLLSLARERGWDVAGVEPNKHLVKWAKKNQNLGIMQGSVYNKRLKRNSFDVITLLDVIEHVHNPIKFLSRCNELLVPGGTIFISTPDIGSPIARVMRRRWFYILSIHVFYFTRQTMSRVLNKAGFDNVKSSPYFLRTRLSYVTEKSKNYIGALGSIFCSVARALGLGNREITYWLGQRMFVARKPRVDRDTRAFK